MVDKVSCLMIHSFIEIVSLWVIVSLDRTVKSVTLRNGWQVVLVKTYFLSRPKWKHVLWRVVDYVLVWTWWSERLCYHLIIITKWVKFMAYNMATKGSTLMITLH